MCFESLGFTATEVSTEIPWVKLVFATVQGPENGLVSEMIAAVRCGWTVRLPLADTMGHDGLGGGFAEGCADDADQAGVAGRRLKRSRLHRGCFHDPPAAPPLAAGLMPVGEGDRALRRQWSGS
jgi:hypothetical protein